MPRKRHTVEEIVAKLRQVDVLTAQGPCERSDRNDRGDGSEFRDELYELAGFMPTIRMLKINDLRVLACDFGPKF
jgi:hypothetical protein